MMPIRETERLRSVEVHCQFEFAGWLNRHSGGLGTPGRSCSAVRASR